MPISAQQCWTEGQLQEFGFQTVFCSPGWTTKRKRYGKGEKMSWNHFYLPLEASNTSVGSLLFGREGLALQPSYGVSIELSSQVSSRHHNWLGFQHFSVLSSYPYRSGWMAEGTLNSFSCTGPTFSLGLLLHLPLCGFLILCFDRFLKKLCQITSHSSSFTLLVSRQIKYIIYLYCSLVLADIILVFCVAAFL